MRIPTILIMLVLAASSVNAETSDTIARTVIKVQVAGVPDIKRLEQMGLSVDDYRDGSVTGLVSEKYLKTILNAGFKAEVLAKDFRDNEPWAWFAKGFYHTHSQMGSALDSIVKGHPTIAHLDTIGYSVNNRAIFALSVSKAPGNKASKPRYLITGDHHGNEMIGGEIILAFAHALTDSYATSPVIKRLVDESEFWLVPMVNPDGRELNQRQNAYNIDLNRDYGYEWNAEGSSTGPFSQKETRNVRDFARSRSFLFGKDYHSGTSKIIYPYGFSRMGPMDSTAMQRLCQIYKNDFPYEYGQVARVLYEAYGGSIDYYYCRSGMATFCAEVYGNGTGSYNPPANALDTTCSRHVRALLATIREARKGIFGVVRDSVTKKPIEARITVAGRGWCAYSDPDSGDYYKYLYPSNGTFQVTATANGYTAKTLSVTVGSDTFATLNFDLKAGSGATTSAFTCEMIRSTQSFSLPGDLPWTMKCLGTHNDTGLTISHSSAVPFAVFDMGGKTPIINKTGNDLTLYLTSAKQCSVQVSKAIDGPWKACGVGSSTQLALDLTTAGIDTARFVKVIAGTAKAGTPSIDAIEGTSLPMGVTLSSFTAMLDKDRVTLGWSTESETDNYAWNLERSDCPDGPYSRLGQIPAAGSSNSPHDYSYQDAGVPPRSGWFYRLYQVSLSGETSFCQQTAIYGAGLSFSGMELRCSPNPVSRRLVIAYNLPQPATISVDIFNVLGQRVRSIVSVQSSAGIYQLNWDRTDQRGLSVAPGVYLVTLSAYDKMLVQRITVIE